MYMKGTALFYLCSHLESLTGCPRVPSCSPYGPYLPGPLWFPPLLKGPVGHTGVTSTLKERGAETEQQLYVFVLLSWLKTLLRPSSKPVALPADKNIARHFHN